MTVVEERERASTFRPSIQGSHNQAVGFRGEIAAALYLERMGFEILETNWRCRFGEADIVAMDEDTLVFVEVKTRTGIDQGLPEEAVTPSKRSRYEKIAASYLADHDVSECPVRFDVIGILAIDTSLSCGKAILRYTRNAFGWN